jgi:hypothetical protein
MLPRPKLKNAILISGLLTLVGKTSLEALISKEPIKVVEKRITNNQ